MYTSEKDFYLEELKKAHEEFWQADENFFNFFKQFSNKSKNGVIIDAGKIMLPENQKKLKELYQTVEEKRDKLREVEKKWASFFS